VSELDAQTRRQLNISGDVDGLVVTDVEPGSAADRAGLQTGDVIEEVNRQPVRSMRDATSAMRNNEGQNGSVLLRVRSDGGTHYVVVDNTNSNRSRTREAPSSGRRNR